MKSAQFWNINNVSSFRGFDVVNGEINLSDSEYAEHLTDSYGYVKVCGYEFASGDVLESQDPVAFRCGKSEYESDIESELEEQLSREDSDDIEFIDGDEYELDDEDSEDDNE